MTRPPILTARNRSSSWARHLTAYALSASALCLALASLASSASAQVKVYAKDQGDRVNPAWPASRSGSDRVELGALRGETAAFQVVVDAGDQALSDLTVEIADLMPEPRRPFAGPAEIGVYDDPKHAREAEAVYKLHTYSLHPEVLVEHYVNVTARSRDTFDLPSSLAWRAGARPDDDSIRGALPDALIPLANARCDKGPTRRFCPYPMQIAAHSLAAFWIDVPVPDTQDPARYTSRFFVKSQGSIIGSIDVAVETSRALLPYRPVSFFSYYDYEALKERFDDPAAVEKSLVRLFHAHGVDAVTAITSLSEAQRVQGAADGSWFRSSDGYNGPGEGVAPAVSVIGAYGSLGEPTAENVTVARAIAKKVSVPRGDTFVYTVDEQCRSPLGKAWKDALVGANSALLTGQTCGEDPSRQSTDIAIVTAQDFDPRKAERARALGKKVFVYNGRLPFAGPLMLDTPLPSLTIDGWISARYDIGRWFLWESTFWNDQNRGGKGPRDPFEDPETFHNADGDACLLDGLLVYPGKQPRFTEHSLGIEAVLPSLRLKALRRGIEDAGLIAVAERVDPVSTEKIIEAIVQGALDEADPQGAPRFSLDPMALSRARAELRAIAERENLSLDDRDIVDDLGKQSIARVRLVLGLSRPRHLVPSAIENVFELLAAGVLFGLGYLGARLAARSRRAL